MNTYSPLDVEVRTHLIELAETIGARPTGSPAGRRAEAYVAGVLERRGWTVERQPFSCLDWAPGPVRVRADGRDWAAVPSPWDRRATSVAPGSRPTGSRRSRPPTWPATS